MRKVPLSSSLMVFILDIVYLHARLVANALTERFAAPVAAQLAKLDAIKACAEKEERAQVLVLARRDHANDTLDERLLRSGQKTEAEVGKRSTPEFKKVFPKSPSDVAAEPYEEEVLSVNAIVAQLKASANPALVALAGPLAAAAAELSTAEHAWKASFTPVAVAAGDRDYEKAQTNVLREKTYGQLLTVFPGQRKRVEAFFRDSPRNAAAEAVVDDPATPDAPADA